MQEPMMKESERSEPNSGESKISTTETFQTHDTAPGDKPHNQSHNELGNNTQTPQIPKPCHHSYADGRSKALSDSYIGVDENTGSDEKGWSTGSAVEPSPSQRPGSWTPHGSPFPASPRPPPSSYPGGSNIDGRQSNPKIARARIRHGRPATGASDSNIPLQLGDGTYLYHLSDTIPYLLGTSEMVGVFDAISGQPELQSSNSLNSHGQSAHLGNLSSQDKALLAVFTLVEKPSANLTITERHWLSLFDVENARVRFWRQSDTAGPTSILITKEDIEVIFREWQSSWELFRASEFDTNWVHRWAGILEHLREKGIDTSSIDSNTFHGLMVALDETEFNHILVNLHHISHSGGEIRPTRPDHHDEGEIRSVSYDNDDPSKLYSHRFCHQNPSGELLRPGIDVEQAGEEADEATRRQRLAAAVREGKQKLKTTKKIRICKCKWLGPILLSAGIVAGILLAFSFKIGVKDRAYNRNN